jgi:hypothetical protein
MRQTALYKLSRTERFRLWLSVKAYKYFNGSVSFTTKKFYSGIEITMVGLEIREYGRRDPSS